MSIYRVLSCIAIFSATPALGCTADDTGGGGGSRPCSDATTSSGSSTSQASSSSHVSSSSSSSSGDGGSITYPDCPLGVARLVSTTSRPYDYQAQDVIIEVDQAAYIKVESTANDLLFLTWADRTPEGQYVWRAPGEPLQVTGGWRQGNGAQIRSVESGSTATFFVDATKAFFERIEFNIDVYPYDHYVGCVRSAKVP